MRNLNKAVNDALRFVIRTSLQNVLETLFGLTALWFAFIAILPSTLIYSSLFAYLDVYNSWYRYGVCLLFACYGAATLYGVYAKHYYTRVAMLSVSSSLYLLYGGVILFGNVRAGGVAGPMFILGALASVSVWQLTRERALRESEYGQ